MDVEALGTALQRESDVEGGEEGNFARMLARKTAEQRKKKKKKLGNNLPSTAPSHHPYACHLHSFRAPLPLQRNARALRKAEQGITQSGCPTVSPPGSRGPVVLWGHPKCHCRGDLASFAAGCGAEAAFFLPSQTVGPQVWVHLPTQGGWDVLHLVSLGSHG